MTATSIILIGLLLCSIVIGLLLFLSPTFYTRACHYFPQLKKRDSVTQSPPLQAMTVTQDDLPPVNTLLADEQYAQEDINAQYNALSYQLRPQFFSAADISLYQALEKVFAHYPYRVLPKTRLIDILTPSDTSQDSHDAAQARLADKQVDFVIMNTRSLDIMGVILFEQEQADLPTRLQHKFITSALNSARIPVLRIPIYPRYPLGSLCKALNNRLHLNLAIDPQLAQPHHQCPRCHANLLYRQIKKGAHKGKYVWVCQRYPQCKTVLSLSTLTQN